MRKRAMITGANRGLGLEFVRQYIASGWEVFATCRNPEAAQELTRLAQSHRSVLNVLPLDVDDFDQIKRLAASLTGISFDLLLNNAGVYGSRTNAFGQIDYDEWASVFRINAMAPLRVSEAFVKHVGTSDRKVIATVTSKMGSITDNTSGGSYVYRSSKAALNAVMKSLALDLRDQGIRVVVLHPGWVKTDMGGPNALIDSQTSVRGMVGVLDRLGSDDTGLFINYDGSPIPW